MMLCLVLLFACFASVQVCCFGYIGYIGNTVREIMNILYITHMFAYLVR